MSDYSRLYNLTIKDSLPSGNSGKVIKGAELDAELNAVAASIASKSDINSPTFTGTPSGPTASVNTSTTQLATTAFVNAERTSTSTLTNKTIVNPVINGSLYFEGATDNSYETMLSVVDPTDDRVVVIPDASTTLVGTDVAQTLTNKTIDFSNNTLNGTIAQFNSALSDGNFATLAGSETLTNKTINGSQLVNASVAPEKLTQSLTLGTKQSPSSGTNVDFTGIPSWVKRITISFAGLTNSAALRIQVGTAGGIVSSGYVGGHSGWSTTVATSTLSNGFDSFSSSASGSAVLTLVDSTTNTWALFANLNVSGTAYNNLIVGHVPLSGVLTTVRITSTTGGTFSAGIVNIMYE